MPNRPTAAHLQRLVPWLLRIAWVAVVLVAVPAIDGACDGRSSALHDVARVGGGVVWLIGVAAMAVPAVVSLTATRVIVPLTVPAAVVCAIGGAGAVAAAGFVAVALLATLIAYTAELGRVFVQASAYGDEERHLLRPPLAYLIASTLTWFVWAGALLSGPLLLAEHMWIAGALLCCIAVGVGLWAWRRWHRLSRRWFVLVPTGVVVHDQLVLGETLMLRRHEVAGLRLAPADTEALDLTGPASGHAVELLTTESTTAVLAATPSSPRGVVIHFTACLVGPSRPGQVLAAARARRLRVG